MSIEGADIHLGLEPRPAQSPRAAAGSVLLAPLGLLRIATLSYARATALALPETSRLIDRSLQCRMDMESERAAVEDALYALVPRLSERKLSGVALKLRRDVHKGRAATTLPAEVQPILNCLPEEARESLARWSAARAELTDLTESAERMFAHEVETHLRPRLRAALDEEFLDRAIGLASPELQMALHREPSANAGFMSSNAERSLLAYLLRASVKTSPFSTFMHVAAVPVGEGGSAALDFDAARPVRHVRLNRGIASRLHKSLVAQAAARGEVRLRLNPTLRRVEDGRIEAVTGQDTVMFGRPWRQVRLARFRFHPTVAALLLDKPDDFTWKELADWVAATGLTGEQANAFVAKLFDRDLIAFPPLIDTFVADPKALGPVDGCPADLAGRVLEIGRRIDAEVASFADANGRERARLVADIRGMETEALALLQPEPAPAYQNVVLEESWLAGVEGSVGGGLPAIVAEVGTFLTQWMVIAPEYLRLREAFKRAYGPGGRCHDVLGFLMKVGDGLVEVPEFGAHPRPPQLVPAPAGSRTGLTAQVQIVAAGAAEAADGRALVVVNRVYERVGWLTARFACGDDAEQESLRRSLGAWLVQATAPREPVDLLLNGHCNDLQAHPQLTKRFLALPGEPVLPHRVGALRLTDLQIVHDPRTDLLEVEDSTGRSIALVYLGSAIPTPSWGGLAYALTVLAQPFQFERPQLSPALHEVGEDLVFEPRLMEGRLVLGRATWWMRASRLRQTWLAAKGAARLLAVASDCAAHGIPRVFFARRNAPRVSAKLIPDNSLDTALKPVWIDTRNPFCLDLLDRMTRETDWVAFSEALPGVGDQWIEIGGEPYASEFQLEMVVTAAERNSRSEGGSSPASEEQR